MYLLGYANLILQTSPTSIKTVTIEYPRVYFLKKKKDSSYYGSFVINKHVKIKTRKLSFS